MLRCFMYSVCLCDMYIITVPLVYIQCTMWTVPHSYCMYSDYCAKVFINIPSGLSPIHSYWHFMHGTIYIFLWIFSVLWVFLFSICVIWIVKNDALYIDCHFYTVRLLKERNGFKLLPLLPYKYVIFEKSFYCMLRIFDVMSRLTCRKANVEECRLVFDTFPNSTDFL